MSAPPFHFSDHFHNLVHGIINNDSVGNLSLADIVKSLRLPAHQHVNKTVPALEHGPEQEPGPLPPASQAILIIVYALATVLAIAGNVLVLLVLHSGKRCRTTVSIYLMNLASADLFMGIFCLPFTFTSTMLNHWIFPTPLCRIVSFVQFLSVYVSVFTLTIIGIDRFLVVVKPLNNSQRVTRSKSKIIVLLLWIVSFALSIPVLIFTMTKEGPSTTLGVNLTSCVQDWPSADFQIIHNLIFISLSYIIPLIILVVTYVKIGMVLWNNSADSREVSTNGVALVNKRPYNRTKLIKMLIAVVVCFGFCWLPLHIFFTIIDFYPEILNFNSEHESELIVAVYYACHWLAMSSSFLNPFIYGFMNDGFRADLKELLSCICCRLRRATLRYEHVKMLLMRPESHASSSRPCSSRNG